MAEQSLQPDQSTAMLQMAMNQPVFGNVKMPPMPMADLQAMYGMMAKDQAARAGQQISGGVPYQTAMAQAQIKQQQAANQLQNSLMMAKLFSGSQMNTAGMQQSANTLMGGQNPLLQGLGFPAGQGQAPTMPTGSMGQNEAQGQMDMLKTFMAGGLSQEDAMSLAGGKGGETVHEKAVTNRNVDDLLAAIDRGGIKYSDGTSIALKTKDDIANYIAQTHTVDIKDPRIQAKLKQMEGSMLGLTPEQKSTVMAIPDIGQKIKAARAAGYNPKEIMDFLLGKKPDSKPEAE